nr:MAG TPA: hypothetical protein [Caudoviricetes sp.]
MFYNLSSDTSSDTTKTNIYFSRSSHILYCRLCWNLDCI